MVVNYTPSLQVGFTSTVRNKEQCSFFFFQLLVDIIVLLEKRLQAIKFPFELMP